jgi:hypothetical protein
MTPTQVPAAQRRRRRKLARWARAQLGRPAIQAALGVATAAFYAWLCMQLPVGRWRTLCEALSPACVALQRGAPPGPTP